MPAWSLTGECYPIDFTGIDIEYYAGRGVYQLTVTGVKPYTNMEVSLSHEAYNGRPAYWRTVVVGCVKNGLADAACLALLRDHEPRQIRRLTRHRDRRVPREKFAAPSPGPKDCRPHPSDALLQRSSG